MWSRVKNLNPLACGILAGVLALGAYLSYYSVKFGLNHPPGATGDEPDYDSLAWELAHGRGFRVDYSNESFRQPYEWAAQDSELYRLRESDRVGPITNRPPLYPLVMSLMNRLLGRQFWGIRVIDALAMAVICGMLVTLISQSASGGRLSPNAPTIRRLTSPARQFASPCCLAGISAFLFVAVDVRTRLYGRAILTEALAAVEIAVLCWLLFRFAERPTRRCAAGIGVLMGIALLTRTQFVLWLPGLLAIVFWLSACRHGTGSTPDAGEAISGRSGRLRPAVISTGIMLGMSVIVATPWMVRNCFELGAFMPLGSQGWVQLSAGFGDSVWEQQGVWPNLAAEGFFEGVVTPEMSPVEAEVAMAHYSRRQAIEWIANHPGKAIALAPLKILQEFRPRTISEGIILTLSILGAVLAWRDLRTKILLAVVLTCCVSIAVTWSVEGRFLVPLLYAQHGLIGLGLVQVFGRRQ